MDGWLDVEGSVLNENEFGGLCCHRCPLPRRPRPNWIRVKKSSGGAQVEDVWRLEVQDGVLVAIFVIYVYIYIFVNVYIYIYISIHVYSTYIKYTVSLCIHARP